MRKRTIIKFLCIIATVLLVTTLFYSEAFARGVARSVNRRRENRAQVRPYRHEYVRIYEPVFFGFRIGDVVVNLPVGYQNVIINGRPYHYYDGIYYEKSPRGYIIFR
ncbi:MAG: DUF6515 family protein [Candidatus Omnitrophota bacterium]